MPENLSKEPSEDKSGAAQHSDPAPPPNCNIALLPQRAEKTFDCNNAAAVEATAAKSPAGEAVAKEPLASGSGKTSAESGATLIAEVQAAVTSDHKDCPVPQ